MKKKFLAILFVIISIVSLSTATSKEASAKDHWEVVACFQTDYNFICVIDGQVWTKWVPVYVLIKD